MQIDRSGETKDAPLTLGKSREPVALGSLDLISARNDISAAVLTSSRRRMGRYKDYHRESKRGGFIDEQGANTPSGRSGYKKKSAPQVPEAVEAVVKWFNAEKGFGFVEVVGGSDAFMHIRQVEAAGHSSVTEGSRVKVLIGQGQKGPEVTEITAVLSSPVAAGNSAERRRVREAEKCK